MKNKFLWTQSKARLNCLYTHSGANFNWLFLPGGPGLGSESLDGLAELLNLPGTVWHLDFPGDGSNTTINDIKYFANWSQSLIEACEALPKVILVAHSSGGMFALATPELEQILSGLVLLDSAPDASWQQYFSEHVKKNPFPEVEKLQKIYDQSPSNENLKNLTLACVPYFSTAQSATQIAELFESLPYNYQIHLWAAKNFDPDYQAKWIPQLLSTLIIAGEYDPITPLQLFIESHDFQRKNILIRKIKQASHFPWLDNPKEFKQVFSEYLRAICQTDL